MSPPVMCEPILSLAGWKSHCSVTDRLGVLMPYTQAKQVKQSFNLLLIISESQLKFNLNNKNNKNGVENLH